MPRYELALIYRIMERPELVEAMKRTSEVILSGGGIIRSMENAGVRKLPYKMFKHGSRFESGNYFLIQFDSPPTFPKTLYETLHLDTDIVRPRVLRMEQEVSRPCKHRMCDFGELDEEMRKRLFQDLRDFVKKL